MPMYRSTFICNTVPNGDFYLISPIGLQQRAGKLSIDENDTIYSQLVKVSSVYGLK